jgi:predicted phosphodiesterase
MYKSVLVISDLHIPYHHPDAFAFLSALKKKYKPDLVVNIGDEIDQHSISFHSHHPDLKSPGDELRAARKYVKELEKIFPKMTLVHSNHSSLVYRKAVATGLSLEYLKSYNEFLQVGPGWQWVDNLTVTLSDGQKCFFTHGMAADVMKVAQQYGMNAVQGHYHSKFSIGYYSNPDKLVWGLQTGCLINQKELAFEYARNFKSRFVIGCACIVSGQPKLMPMVLKDGGRWIKKIV